MRQNSKNSSSSTMNPVCMVPHRTGEDTFKDQMKGFEERHQHQNSENIGAINHETSMHGATPHVERHIQRSNDRRLKGGISTRPQKL